MISLIYPQAASRVALLSSVPQRNTASAASVRSKLAVMPDQHMPDQHMPGQHMSSHILGHTVEGAGRGKCDPRGECSSTGHGCDTTDPSCGQSVMMTSGLESSKTRSISPSPSSSFSDGMSGISTPYHSDWEGWVRGQHWSGPEEDKRQKLLHWFGATPSDPLPGILGEQRAQQKWQNDTSMEISFAQVIMFLPLFMKATSRLPRRGADSSCSWTVNGKTERHNHHPGELQS